MTGTVRVTGVKLTAVDRKGVCHLLSAGYDVSVARISVCIANTGRTKCGGARNMELVAPGSYPDLLPSSCCFR
jgi:hypothetical protein